MKLIRKYRERPEGREEVVDFVPETMLEAILIAIDVEEERTSRGPRLRVEVHGNVDKENFYRYFVDGVIKAGCVEVARGVLIGENRTPERFEELARNTDVDYDCRAKATVLLDKACFQLDKAELSYETSALEHQWEI